MLTLKLGGKGPEGDWNLQPSVARRPIIRTARLAHTPVRPEPEGSTMVSMEAATADAPTIAVIRYLHSAAGQNASHQSAMLHEDASAAGSVSSKANKRGNGTELSEVSKQESERAGEERKTSREVAKSKGSADNTHSPGVTGARTSKPAGELTKVPGTNSGHTTQE